MSRITLFQGLLMNLGQEIEEDRFEYLTKEEAYRQLKQLTGQDFGYDVKKWKQWIKENKVSAKYPKGKPLAKS
jgi:aminopeptidase C